MPAPGLPPPSALVAPATGPDLARLRSWAGPSRGPSRLPSRQAPERTCRSASTSVAPDVPNGPPAGGLRSLVPLRP